MNGGCLFYVHRGSPLSGRSVGPPARESGEDPRGDTHAERRAGLPDTPVVAGTSGGRKDRGKRVVSERRVGTLAALPLCIFPIPLSSLP